MSYIISEGMKPPQNLLDEMSKVLEEYRIKKEGFTRDQLAEAISQALIAGDFVKFVEGTDRQAIVYIPYWGRNFVARERDSLESQLTEARDRLDRIVKYCEPHTEFMWAASIVGIALDCDFRDAKQKIQEPNGKKDG